MLRTPWIVPAGARQYGTLDLSETSPALDYAEASSYLLSKSRHCVWKGRDYDRDQNCGSDHDPGPDRNCTLSVHHDPGLYLYLDRDLCRSEISHDHDSTYVIYYHYVHDCFLSPDPDVYHIPGYADPDRARSDFVPVSCPGGCPHDPSHGSCSAGPDSDGDDGAAAAACPRSAEEGAAAVWGAGAVAAEGEGDDGADDVGVAVAAALAGEAAAAAEAACRSDSSEA